jgi:polysaccharide export outer membrane protein
MAANSGRLPAEGALLSMVQSSLPASPFGMIPLVLASLVLGACADGRGGPIPYDVALAAPDAPKPVALEQDYRIAPLDTVTVKVFKMPDLSGDYDVDLAGRISMPLIGEVSAVDTTTAELDRALTAKLGEKYLENPDVSVGIKASTRRSVTLDGSVKKAGTYPVNGSLTLMQAVALAGGVGEDANVHRVAVFRTVGGKRQAAAFDLEAVRRGQKEDPAIYPGDIIVIDGSKIKALQKQILSSLPVLSIFGPL